MRRLLLLVAIVGAASEEIFEAVRAVARGDSVLGLLNQQKQHYDAAMVLLAISEAVRLGALDENDARDVLDATRYERETFAAGHDDDNMKISFVRGDYDGLAPVPEPPVAAMASLALPPPPPR